MPAAKPRKQGKPSSKPRKSAKDHDPLPPEERPAPRYAPEMVPQEQPDPAAETKASGSLVATARAFNPARVGVSKTVGAILVLLFTLGLAVSFDVGLLPKDGLVFYLYTALVAVAGNVLRHLGTRWDRSGGQNGS